MVNHDIHSELPGPISMICFVPPTQCFCTPLAVHRQLPLVVCPIWVHASIRQVQVDLSQEARNLWQFNFNFRKSSNVRFPVPTLPFGT